MPGKLTSQEDRLRKEMSRIYKGQEKSLEGYDDWGEFTAHVVLSYRQEVERLRGLLKDQRIDGGTWDDPLKGDF